MFSKACEYGIRASIFIALSSREGGRVSPREIAEEINSPQAFTAKILQALVKHNIINSMKGAFGGFEIDKNTVGCIKISEIVDAIDGNSVYKSCAIGLETCDESHPCPVHHKFKGIKNQLKHMLENTTLEELANNFESGKTFLKK